MKKGRAKKRGLKFREEKPEGLAGEGESLRAAGSLNP
jgi:hypothetical protein